MRRADLPRKISLGRPIRVIMVGPGLQVKGGISTVERLITKYNPRTVRILHVSTSEDGSVVRKASVFLFGAMKFVCALIVFRPDLAHIHFSKRGSTWRKWVIMLLALCFRIPVLLHAHSGDFPPFFDALPSFSKKLVASVFRRAHKLVTLSQSWHDYYASCLHLPDDAIIVLPNPVELPHVQPVLQHGKNVAYLGKISQEKGAIDLIEAFSRIPKEDRCGAHLVLAGNGDVTLAQRKIDELGIREDATIVGWLTPSKRDELLREIQVFALPSYYEGLPMSLLEAMANGVAVIATPVGGIPEVIQDGVNGVLVPVGKVEILAAELKGLLENPKRCHTLGEKARETVSDYGIEHYISTLVKVYEQCAY